MSALSNPRRRRSSASDSHCCTPSFCSWIIKLTVIAGAWGRHNAFACHWAFKRGVHPHLSVFCPWLVLVMRFLWSFGWFRSLSFRVLSLLPLLNWDPRMQLKVCSRHTMKWWYGRVFVVVSQLLENFIAGGCLTLEGKDHHRRRRRSVTTTEREERVIEKAFWFVLASFYGWRTRSSRTTLYWS